MARALSVHRVGLWTSRLDHTLIDDVLGATIVGASIGALLMVAVPEPLEARWCDVPDCGVVRVTYRTDADPVCPACDQMP